MKVLVACEWSGTVRDALMMHGIDAVSCDVLPSVIPGPHLQCDVRDVISRPWRAVIAFPDCTHIAVSGALHFAAKRADGRQQEAIEFFLQFARLPCPWAIENPVGIMSRLYRKADQIIQPWQFGHPESKKTCLWLHRLPPLNPTWVLKPPACGHWQNQTPSGQNKLGPSPERAKIRGKTYEGIALAMADQWGKLLK